MKEFNRLCDLGVLEWQPASEWTSPAFIVPKKDQTLCFLIDFREVNKQLLTKFFHYIKLAHFCKSLMAFVATLDLIVGYNIIKLDPDASKICTIFFMGLIILPQVNNGNCRFS